MKNFWKKLGMARAVMRSDECFVVIKDDEEFHYMHNGVSLSFLHVFLKVVCNAKTWYKEWCDLNSID